MNLRRRCVREERPISLLAGIDDLARPPLRAGSGVTRGAAVRALDALLEAGPWDVTTGFGGAR